MHGTIRKWNDERGFGFIEPAGGGNDVFLHVSAFPRGIRPVVGDAVSFDLVVDADGRRRAAAVQVPDARRGRSTRRHVRKPRKEGGWVPLVAAVVLVAIGVAAYPHVRPWFDGIVSGREMTSGRAYFSNEPDPTHSPRFQCDGRIHCSQMHSCAEAKFFLANCPGTKMDGDHDGVPCEQQHCSW
ncbi:MAG TPA: cold shock domain-containing protein [Dokdonella sp.]|uniref:cold shock domain-containing protein n=1 Tax=Dokdonella sp. TaxID=2291710 RepID=UPI0025C3F4FD|nr:cold shock domain-containing protein [Dokdonella sp.]MBX3691249.1 cold shock domain-containing protein [Dokdonella sp.]HNR91333.1 cold shock domain-containing protein [Dokdonella sp.]